MLTLSAVKLYPADATDLVRSIDGLSGVVGERFALEPLFGHLFLFRSRRRDRLKILPCDPVLRPFAAALPEVISA